MLFFHFPLLNGNILTKVLYALALWRYNQARRYEISQGDGEI